MVLIITLMTFLSQGTSSPIPQPAPQPLFLAPLVDLVKAKLGVKAAIIDGITRWAIQAICH